MGLQPIGAREEVTRADGDVTPGVQCPCVQSGESREQGTEELERNHLCPEHCEHPFTLVVFDPQVIFCLF